MCSGGGGGGGAPAQPSAPAPPPPSAAPPLNAPQVPNPQGGNNPNSPGYRGFETPSTARRIVKKGGGSGNNVNVPGGSGIKM